MRRLGWLHGWVRTYECRLFDPLGQRRAANPVDRPTGNGGFQRVPRKPTGHSKFTGGHRYRWFRGKHPSRLRRAKFRHYEEKLWYQEAADIGIFYQEEEEEEEEEEVEAADVGIIFYQEAAAAAEAPTEEAEFNIELQEAGLQIMPCNNLLEEADLDINLA